MCFFAGVKSIGFTHQCARANQQVAKTCTRADAGVAVVRGVAVGEVAGMFPLACVKHVVVRHKHLVEHHDACTLAILAAEQRRAMFNLFTGAARWPGNDGDAGCVDWHRAADSKVSVFLAHIAARHDEQFVHVRRACHDGFGTADHDAF